MSRPVHGSAPSIDEFFSHNNVPNSLIREEYRGLHRPKTGCHSFLVTLRKIPTTRDGARRLDLTRGITKPRSRVEGTLYYYMFHW